MHGNHAMPSEYCSARQYNSDIDKVLLQLKHNLTSAAHRDGTDSNWYGDYFAKGQEFTPHHQVLTMTWRKRVPAQNVMK